MLRNEAQMSELTRIFNQLTPTRQDQVLILARALLDKQQNAGSATAPAEGKRRGRPKGRKGSSYETTKSVTNSTGTKYRYRVHVTVDASSKRKEKYLGRADQ
jgi:hypothetical protein